MVAYAFNPSTQEAEAGRFLSSRPARLQNEFQDSQGYTEKPCLEKPNRKQKTEKNKQTPKPPSFLKGQNKGIGEMAQQLSSSRGSEFNAQPPQDGSQPSVMGFDALFWCA